MLTLKGFHRPVSALNVVALRDGAMATNVAEASIRRRKLNVFRLLTTSVGSAGPVPPRPYLPDHPKPSVDGPFRASVQFAHDRTH